MLDLSGPRPVWATTAETPPDCVLAGLLVQHLDQQYSSAVLALTFDSGPPDRPTAKSYVFYFFRGAVDSNRPPDDVLTFKVKLSNPEKVHLVDKYLGGVTFGAENAPPLAQRHLFKAGELSNKDEAVNSAAVERLIQTSKAQSQPGESQALRPATAEQRSNNFVPFFLFMLACIGVGYFLIQPARVQQAPPNTPSTNTSVSTMEHVYVNTLKLNVRFGPGTSYGVSTRLARGDTVLCCIERTRIEDGGTWVKIRAGVLEGWVNEKLLTKNPPPQQIEYPSNGGGDDRTRAASFDCAKAIKNAERLVCTNNELSALDGRMADAYRLVAAVSPYKERLKSEQRGWLKNHRNTCATIECLHTAYQKRIEALERARNELEPGR